MGERGIEAQPGAPFEAAVADRLRDAAGEPSPAPT